ncbi:NAD(P)/FAD-dependent oxidoreductase [Amycolatopsis anabasis]|uniref:FAD/NAD(P)-dependent oxidoreductase n=1 Tax=Amycolatopsis anabasis TaxID=1840409 RepID=UPI00131ABFBD|nr:NAD(P)/FAD-dependent oxidoreductase [Amycolatopsis anabasis]
MIVVVGAGPAGMAAARTAARAGAAVVLIDSAPRAGGQYHRQNPWGAEKFSFPDNVVQLGETVVWACEPIEGGHRLHLRTGPADGPGRRATCLDAAALVLATGAYDRALPFPGWDLPGVYTAGAAQALAKGQGIAVGERVLLAGTGPFLLPVAESLLGAGARVLGVLEANGPGARWLAEPSALKAGWRKAGELAGYARLLARHRVPYRPRTAVIAAHGREHVESATVARLDADWNVVPGSEERVVADAVCAGFGFTPQLELAVSARCAIEHGCVAVNLAQATSTSGVFAAGEITGIGGADLAAAEGEVAGAAAARFLGVATEIPRRALRRVRAGRRFADGLGRVYPIRDGWRAWLREDTLVCRCEEVSYGELTGALARRDALGVRALKLVGRAGLGPCQGRICGATLAELTRLPEGAAAFARRPIAAPLRLGELAETETPWEEKE